MTKKKLRAHPFLKCEVGNLRDLIVQGLDDRFGKLLSNRNVAVAQFLDPRIKDRNADFPELFQKKYYHDFLRPPSPKRSRGLLASFEESMAENETASTSFQTQPDLRKEFTEYVTMVREQIDSDPMIFWKNNAAKLPLLSKAAARFLSAPATSVCSEQAFSTARDVFTYRRMSIKPRKAEMVIFLKRALPMINYHY
uniref:HAT C-terminal dimerisation domain-containing protein n=1 Tax=Globodera rostochiensis TaxID=31243 RepID=A0A914H8R7_GLORO